MGKGLTNKKEFALKTLPLIFINSFVAITLVWFKFGLIHWNVPKVNVVIIYILLTYAVFSAGYIFVVYNSKPLSMSFKEKKIAFCYARIIMIVGITVSIIYYIAWIFFTFGSDFFSFLRYPGAAYDYMEYLDALYKAGNGYEYPMVFRWISRINTVMGALTTAAIPLALYLFGTIGKIEKIGVVSLIALYLLRNLLLGAQSSFLILLLMITVVMMVQITNYLMQCSQESVEKKDKVCYILRRLGIICIFVLILFGIMIFFQNDRVKQREIRNELYGMSMEHYGSVSHDLLEDNLLRSIEIRVGKQLFDIERIDLMQKQLTTTNDPQVDGALLENEPKTDEVNENNIESQVGKNLVDDQKVDSSNTLEKNFTGIDQYYESVKSEWLYSISPSLYYGIQSVEMYVTQGYAALALAFEHEFEWTYFVGSSKILTNMIEKITGVNISERTYVYKNEEHNGWSASTYFNSLYTWLASDFTFAGVIFLFGLFGMLFAKVWLDIIIRKNPFALVMFYTLMFGWIMATTVNILFQTLGSFISSWGVIVLYIFSILLTQKGDFIYEKFISKNRR